MSLKLLPNELLLSEVARLLAQGERVALMTKGNSMLPFITGERDRVVLFRTPQVAVGDIVLARTDEGVFVLHRIVGIDGDRITLMGDGNLCRTETCTREAIAGQAIRIVKPRRTVDCTTPCERRKARLWRALLPVRRYLLAIYRRIDRLLPQHPTGGERKGTHTDTPV